MAERLATPKSKANILQVPEDRISHKKRSHGDTVTCTACSQRLDAYRLDWMRRHPLLDVLLCKRCYSLHSKEIQVGEDGMDEACRWCALEGDLICCDFCHNVFCKLCIRRNLGRAHLNIILNAEEDQKWQCYVCNPEPLLGLVASCSEILKSAEEMNESKVVKKLLSHSDLSDEASVGSSPKPKRLKKNKITTDIDNTTTAIKNDELEGTVSEKGEEINENDVCDDEDEDEEDNNNNNNKKNKKVIKEEDSNNEKILDQDDDEEEDDDEDFASDDSDIRQILEAVKNVKEKKFAKKEKNEISTPFAPVTTEANAAAAVATTNSADLAVDEADDDDSKDAKSEISKIIKTNLKDVESKAPQKMNEGDVIYIKTPTGEIVGLKATSSKSLKSNAPPLEDSTSSQMVIFKRPKGRPKIMDKKPDKITPTTATTGKKYPRSSSKHKNTLGTLAAVAGLKLSSRPPHIDQNNVWNVLERLLAATQSMTMLLTSLKEDLKRAATISSGFPGPGKVPDLKKKRKEVASKLWRAFLAYKKSFVDIEIYSKKKKARLEGQQHQQQQQFKISKEFLGDDVDDDAYNDSKDFAVGCDDADDDDNGEAEDGADDDDGEKITKFLAEHNGNFKEDDGGMQLLVEPTDKCEDGDIINQAGEMNEENNGFNAGAALDVGDDGNNFKLEGLDDDKKAENCF